MLLLERNRSSPFSEHIFRKIDEHPKPDSPRRHIVIDNPWIPGFHVCMEKLQILFPQPQLQRLRGLAKKQDAPVSELIRKAVDLWLESHDGQNIDIMDSPPQFHCGKILVKAQDLRTVANESAL